MTISDDERMRRGGEIFNKMFPPGTLPQTGVTPPPEAQDLGKLAMGAVFGELWTRPGLDLRSRSLVTMSALTALGRSVELGIHVRGALNLGISRQEICEAIMHLCMYAGFPAAVDGLRVAATVFEEVDAKARG